MRRPPLRPGQVAEHLPVSPSSPYPQGMDPPVALPGRRHLDRTQMASSVVPNHRPSVMPPRRHPSSELLLPSPDPLGPGTGQGVLSQADGRSPALRALLAAADSDAKRAIRRKALASLTAWAHQPSLDRIAATQIFEWVADLAARGVTPLAIIKWWRCVDDARSEMGLSPSRELGLGARLFIGLRRRVTVNPPRHAALTGDMFDVAELIPHLDKVDGIDSPVLRRAALTRRASVLLRICTALRSGDVARIYCSSITVINTFSQQRAVQFCFLPKQTAGREVRRAYSLVEFLPEEMADICPARCLLEVKRLRPACSHDFLFSSAKRPFAALQASTLSRYAKAVLQRAGYADKFVPHSIRFLTRNKWLAEKVPPAAIRARAGWAALNREEASYSSLDSSFSLSLIAVSPFTTRAPR
mmetsp:Transcript_11118/g.35305  ORF Transcript_11118/g.35305 Transcript_11118/m.35305 type:complete len:414 (+) Transcript_11118:2356-3597(+)